MLTSTKRVALARALAPTLLMLTTVALASGAIAACGGDDDGDSGDAGGAGTTSATTSGAGGDTVSVRSIEGAGEVLVDSEGNALYTNDRDSGSMVACTGKCASIWVPLAAPSAGMPTAGDPSLQAELGVVKRPDGASQVTYDGMPLYTFVEDGGPGRVTGDGFADSFAGTEFAWTVASTDEASEDTGGAETTTEDEDGGGGGGY
jgi:predicted lipoprotein with Yx(FWY)xxD motif